MITDTITKTDMLHRDRMAVGSRLLLNAIDAARTGRVMPKKSLPGEGLVWDDGSNGGTMIGSPLSATAQRQLGSVAAHLAEKDRVHSLTVKRDPCPKCGVRSDLGCKHTPLRAASLTHEHVNEAWEAAIVEAREMHRRKAAA